MPWSRKARSLRRTWEPSGDGRHICNLPLSDLLGIAVVDTHDATLEPKPGYASGQLGPVQVGVGGGSEAPAQGLESEGPRGLCPFLAVRP